MKIPKELFCRKCPKAFCCVDCRFLHEQKKHNFIKIIDDIIINVAIDCPICGNKPFILEPRITDANLLDHIEKTHLPLQCVKCSKMYSTIEEVQNFSNCFRHNKCCDTEKIEEIASTETNGNLLALATIGTQTSPYKVDSGQMSILSVQIKTKTTSKRESIGELLTSDSASSLKNISSITNCSLRRSIDINTTMPLNKGKLVRTTSTPLSTDVPISSEKMQAQHQNNSTEQISSIKHSLNYNEENYSHTPSFSKIQRYQKMLPRTLKVPNTPLRQVMSKSIQKAIAEHNKSPMDAKLTNRKGSLDSNSPLDLRLSPVIRRAQSDILALPQKQLNAFSEICSKEFASQKNVNIKKQSESIRVVKMRRTSISSQSSNSSTFQTCESLEIITQTSETSRNLDIYSTATTPRISRTKSTKITDFREISSSESLNSDSDTFRDDVFYTPRSSPKEKSSKYGVEKRGNEMIESRNPQNLEENSKMTKPLWSLFNMVLRHNKGEENIDPRKSILKRCASFAGALIKPKVEDDEYLRPIKRKRTQTESTCSLTMSPAQLNSSKRLRIQARKPIDRMRKNIQLSFD